ncbi:unnamed protein product [Clonostachys rosea]|uniref:Cleavage/polyadenylation specificity factor A subunit C-terminal domain-containing protein n=1 Tax=Bionectria ochroleuca TaxID=29856 RepID=A0ABY6TS12_BIOOC|nr:unnamed protein product [Clonostachys rosea]
MQAYTELAAPTAVSYSLALPLTSATASNLVVAKGSLLQIFATKTVSAELDSQKDETATSTKAEIPYDHRVNDDDGLESSFLGGESMLVRTDRSNNTKLVLVAEIPLAGTVIGMARLKLSNTASGGEALLLAYKAAKLCLTEWDPERNTLETISLHYYEKDDIQAAPWELPLNEYVNYLDADPGSRCAAFKFGSRNLAILPFRQSEEDLEMDDWDEDLDGPRPVKESNAGAVANGASDSVEQAYTASFVLRLPLIEPSLLHPIHLAFLHEYREPTFGILSSTQPPSAALGAKDHLSYQVFTLDLQQKASTTILSVTDLPRDLFKVVPLPAPIGGALLLGENELIHVDQSGRTNGVAVNPITKHITSFNLVDQSDLGLRLEGSVVEILSLDHGELLLVTKEGYLVIITFRIDGRTVSGLSLRLVAEECGGHLFKSRATCISKLGKNSCFIGSETGDSVVLGWTRRQSQEKRKRSRIIDPDLGLDVDEMDIEDFDDDDDLYGNTSTAAKPVQTGNESGKSGDLNFRVNDSLICIAPINDFTCGKPAFALSSEEATLAKGVTADLELACAVGKGRAGSIAVINRGVQPKIIGRFEFPEARGFWTVRVKKPAPNALTATAGSGHDYDAAGHYDKYMIVAKVDLDGYETSDVYALTAAGFESIKDTEFEPAAGFTVEAGTMGNENRIIQVLKSEVRCYDGDLGLAQILPMFDEDTNTEPRVLSASISDPYLLLVRDDSNIFLAQIQRNNELEEVDKDGSPLNATKWSSGCLYKDIKGVFQSSKGSGTSETIMMFLLSSSGALHIYALPDLSKPVFVSDGLSYLPPFLSTEFTVRKGSPRDTFTECLVADLGDSVSQTPYLILRNSNDDITLYEPLRSSNGEDSTLSTTLVFKKASNSVLARKPVEEAKEDDDESEQPRFVPLRPSQNVQGYSTVFLPGPSPSFIIKSSKSVPRVVPLQGLGVRGMSSFHTEGCDRGFIYADSEGIARVAQLPPDRDFTQLGVAVRKVPLGVEVKQIAYHPPTETYVAGCLTAEPFELPRDDDYHKEWAKETLPFAPTMARGVLKLINPITWTAINDFELESSETIESMKTLNLEVSEETKERRMLLAVGSALSKGEDLPTRGRVQVLDIVTVIPEPGHPETNRRLKPVAKEDIPRGGVTALSEIGTQGLMLVAQGQKCMVRGLKEDGSLLPVAFLDMNCHVASARALPRTGLCLLADTFKGVWFAGYTEEPYTFKVLGKSGSRVPILTADFLPDGEDLVMVAIDADGDMHILEFNPDHAKSFQGSLLLHRTTFSLTPNPATNSLLLPHSSDINTHLLLLSSPSGHLSSLNPISESAHRRLYSLQTQLLSILPSYAGLNSKAHRLPSASSVTTNSAGRSIGVDTAAGRSAAIIDGEVLARWTELSTAKRAELAGKGGYDSVQEMRDELQGVLGWTGLSYF